MESGPDLQIEAWAGHFECVRNSFTQHWSGNQKAVLSTTSMQSMVLLGGLGACPPEKFVKLHALRSNLRAFQEYIGQ